MLKNLDIYISYKMEKMDIEPNQPKKISLVVDGNNKEVFPLKDIEQKCDAFVADIKNGKNKVLKEYQEIIYNIETSSEFNFYFLKFLKENDISYEEEGDKWDYESNFKALKDTLTDEQIFRLITLKNPLTEIHNVLKELTFDKKGLTPVQKNAKFQNIVSKFSKTFNKLNFPLINSIESLRLKYYKELILDNNISNNCFNMKKYIDILDQDKDIFNGSLNEQKLNQKTYLLILTLTKTFELANQEQIINFFTKNITDDDIKENYKHINLEKNDEYIVKTHFENRKINGKDYILSGLNNDIHFNKIIPIDFLLLRNESYEKFMKDGGKGFIYKLGLYDNFINYIKSFLRSKAIVELLKSKENLKNNQILLQMDSFFDEMLNEKYLRFLPFYGSKKFLGYTNKDIMISFINSIPGIPSDLSISDDDSESEIQNLYHICLLFAIGEKFVTSLHEFAIHLVSSYIYFVSSKQLSSYSYKEDRDQDDGGFFFERKMKGDKKFEFLNINTIVSLLDGVSCHKTLSEFQSDLNADIDIDKIIKRLNNGEIKGFLKDFLEKFPIDFNYFKDPGKKNTQLSCRKIDGIGISLDRKMPDKYGGGEAIKDNK